MWLEHSGGLGGTEGELTDVRVESDCVVMAILRTSAFIQRDGKLRGGLLLFFVSEIFNAIGKCPCHVPWGKQDTKLTYDINSVYFSMDIGNFSSI